jgi:uncharacterized protein (DUF885 family)
MNKNFPMKYFGWMVFSFLFLSASSPWAKADAAFQKKIRALIAEKEQLTDSQRLKKLFELDWDWQMHQFPESATYEGYPGQDDRWSDLSEETYKQIREDHIAELDFLNSIDQGKLCDSDRLNYDLFKDGVNRYLQGFKFHSEYLQVGPLGGIHQHAAETFEFMPTATLKNFQDRIIRLKKFPRVIEQATLLMKKGIKMGITPPQSTLVNVPKAVMAQLEEDPEKNPILASFQKMPKNISKKDKARLKKEAALVLRNDVLPVMKKFHEFLTKTYIPACRKEIAWSALPMGQEWYSFLVRRYTTTDLSPQKIHEIGLAEVARIKKEMKKLLEKNQIQDDLPEFNQKINRDPKYFFKTRKEVLSHYQKISKEIDGKLPQVFGRLPKMKYEVRPVPEYSEKTQVTAYYDSGSVTTGRPGIFWANTYALDTRPIWEMTALFLHEAVPGHHLQISIAKELQGLPEFRKNMGFGAYVEGWGLYAEGLGEDLQAYHDVYSQYGRYAFEIWRSIRLVVDTGIHSMGWSREKAIQFFRENSPKSDHDIGVEVDRYIVLPAQALTYKIGELKFQEIRKAAEEKLGTRFDIRAFHDAVLGNGALPLDILEKRMKEWINLQASQVSML